MVHCMQKKKGGNVVVVYLATGEGHRNDTDRLFWQELGLVYRHNCSCCWCGSVLWNWRDKRVKVKKGVSHLQPKEGLDRMQHVRPENLPINKEEYLYLIKV